MKQSTLVRSVTSTILIVALSTLTVAAPPHRPDGLIHGPQKKHAGRANPDYQLVPIPIPPDALNGAEAININNRGTVSGQLYLSPSFPPTQIESFVWKDGQLTRYAAPGATITAIGHIADSERFLFGSWGTVNEQRAGFLDLQTGAWNALPQIPGKPINFGQRANNRGQAMGGACEGTSIQSFNCAWWVWDGRRYTFPDHASASALPFGINDRGQIVGQIVTPSPFNVNAFFFERGQFSLLAPEKTAVAYGINNVGEITLFAADSPFEVGMPFLLGRAGLRPLPVVADSLTTLWLGINERGDLAGTAIEPGTFIGRPYVALRK